eukprot:TRINITY_DN1637_c0_g1_i1.p1 TRINITY_DN1637_c0_g1~~TRINITY_DN1637_c0_g1_i1.p1  ORF type:complete len:147 (+),score=16.09 TRINITY_DN1637_c0_g1_i1:34-474(+)
MIMALHGNYFAIQRAFKKPQTHRHEHTDHAIHLSSLARMKPSFFTDVADRSCLMTILVVDGLLHRTVAMVATSMVISTMPISTVPMSTMTMSIAITILVTMVTAVTTMTAMVVVVVVSIILASRQSLLELTSRGCLGREEHDGEER